jgi:two-component system chemotaxis response regulator CheY
LIGRIPAGVRKLRSEIIAVTSLSLSGASASHGSRNFIHAFGRRIAVIVCRVGRAPVLAANRQPLAPLAAGGNPSSSRWVATGRVLIVEDDTDIRETVCEVLTELGFVVDTQANGREAMDWLRASPANRPDVVVLDLLMPVMDGYEFIDAVRSDPSLSKLPIVLSTAVRPLQDDSPISGIAIVRKPYELEELLSAIKVAIEIAVA